MAVPTRVAAIFLLVSVAAATPAMGQAQAEAEKLFREAQALRAAGKLAEACDAFEGSERLDPSHATVMNVADCRERNGQLATAWGLFVQVASRARADVALAEAAAKRARKVEPRLSHLIINVPDESRLDGLAITRNGAPVDPATWNRAMPIDGGTYIVVGKAPDHEPWQTEVVVAPERDKQSVDVPRFKTVVALVSNDPAAEVSEGRSRLTGSRKVALGLGSAALVSLGTALVSELSGRSTQDDYDRAPAGPARDELYERANRKHHLAQGLAIAGVAVGAVAGYLWLTGAPKRGERTARVTPRFTPGSASLVIAGGF